MSDDHAARLREFADAVDADRCGRTALTDVMHDAADEVEALRRWKAEATEVIGQWEKVWLAAGKPGQLGQSKSSGVTDEIQALRDIVRQAVRRHPLDHDYVVVRRRGAIYCDGDVARRALDTP